MCHTCGHSDIAVSVNFEIKIWYLILKKSQYPTVVTAWLIALVLWSMQCTVQIFGDTNFVNTSVK